MYLLSMMMSLVVVTMSLHRYNERLTSSIASVLVSLPHTVATVTVRCLALALILSFYPVLWSVSLVMCLVLGNMIVNAMCHIRTKSEEEDEASCCECWKGVLCTLPKKIVKAVISIVSPMDYSYDR